MVTGPGDGQVQTATETPEAFKTWQPADWAPLEGLNVEVYENGRFIDRGRVEAVTNDGCILWLAQEGIDSRRLVEQMPGTDVIVIPGRRFR